MSHINKVKIRRIVIEPAPIEYISPFLGVGIRELSRKTGLDAAYLSRVKNGRTTVTLERYMQLVKASLELSGDEEHFGGLLDAKDN